MVAELGLVGSLFQSGRTDNLFVLEWEAFSCRGTRSAGEKGRPRSSIVFSGVLVLAGVGVSLLFHTSKYTRHNYSQVKPKLPIILTRQFVPRQNDGELGLHLLGVVSCILLGPRGNYELKTNMKNPIGLCSRGIFVSEPHPLTAETATHTTLRTGRPVMHTGQDAQCGARVRILGLA